MKKTISILLFSLSFIGIGCNNTISKKEAKHKLEMALKIKISDSIAVDNYDYSYSTTSDYAESFSVQFQKDEFERIFRYARPKLVKTDTTLYYVEIHADGFISITFKPETETIYYNYIYE